MNLCVGFTYSQSYDGLASRIGRISEMQVTTPGGLERQGRELQEAVTEVCEKLIAKWRAEEEANV